MNVNTNIEGEIVQILKKRGSLSVAFLTRILNENGVECTRQLVERTLRKLISKGEVESFYNGGRYNRRKHYRLRVGGGEHE